MCLVMKMGWFLQFTFQIKKFEDSIDLSLLIDDEKPHLCVHQTFQ